jgi:MoaA/NifB/PqqE/SkfB family radical SAM enzyme
MKPEDNTFRILSIQTTYKCNMTCANCYLGDMLNNPNYKDVHIERFEDAISRLPNKTEIRFIGAEPTMNDNLFDMIRIVKKYNHLPSLLTNGLKLAQEDYVINLKKSGLNFLGLSMNGGLDDEVYKRFDNGKFATVKKRALENCIKHKLVPHINIIVDPTNIHILKPLLSYIEELCKKYNRKSGIKFPIVIRIKSVGNMGNYLDTYTYNINELIDIAKENFGEFVPKFEVNGYKETNTCVYQFESKAGTIYGKCTDWTVDDDGLPDRGSKRRGILTEDYEIEPFFEYYETKVDGPRKIKLELINEK